MPELRTCRACGADIQSNAPFGHCPKCLLKMGFGPVPEELPQPGAASNPGTVRYFGDYELLDFIAQGGMGTVYKACQTSLNRHVALKLISAGALATDDLVKRFKAEAESAASLSHPNIVPIFEIGRHEGQHYFSMGLIEGGSLAEKLRRLRGEDGPKHLLPRDSAQLLSTVARAVHYAHRRGVLHRDLKPSNILLDAHGQPHLTDFGLAKLIEKESTLTHPNAVMGTPAYMSPEQARGDSKDVTTATDVWGLGAVLYETLTGSPPFGGGTSMETIRQVIEQEPRRPSILNPAVDRDLETICLKCLSKDSRQRYGSAEMVAVELDRWRRGEPILARPVTQVERLWRCCRRQPAIAGLATGIVLAASIGVAAWLVAREKAQIADQAMFAKAKADEEAEHERTKTAEILRANDQFLLRQVFTETNNSTGPVLLKALEAAIRNQPGDSALWIAKTEVLKRMNRLEEALENLTGAIAHTNLADRARIEMLLTRSRVLRQLQRQNDADTDYSEAGRLNCQKRNIPARNPRTTPEMLDLSPFFQSRLSSWLSMLSADGDAAINTIRDEVKLNTGVEFDLRGGLNVVGRRKSSPPNHQYLSCPPESLTGIAVNRRFLRLHVLHSVWGSAPPNTKIGAYVLRYVDGQAREAPILYGQHVRDVWLRDPKPPTGALVAWQGKSTGRNKDSQGIRFFKATWENPRPEIEVLNIDLATTSPDVYPILLGVNVEGATPGSPEFWSMKAMECEEKNDWEGAIRISDQAIGQFPVNPGLWLSRGRLLERANRTNDALQAYTEAVQLAARDSNALKVQTAALLERSSLLNRLGLFDEAGADNCRARRIPLRMPQTRPELIDLSRFYNGSLGNFLPSRDSEATEMLSRVAQRNTGVAFDARGYVGLLGKRAERAGIGHLLQSVIGVPVNRRVKGLHIMHTTYDPEQDGTAIGYYVMHYLDGQSETLPIIYGEDLRDRLHVKVLAPTSRAKVAWTGDNGKTAHPPREVRNTLYQVTWFNPRPEVEIKSLDFVSAMTESGPVLIAITVEP